MIGAEVDEEAILVSDVLIDTSGEQPLVGQVIDVRLELKSAGSASGQGNAAIAAAAGQNVCRTAVARSVVVKGNFGGIADGREIGEGSGLKGGARNVYGLGSWYQQTKAFGIHEEEGFILHDGTSDGSRPLVRIVEWTRGYGRGVVVKPIIGVENASIPEIFGVAVEVVAARLGNVIYVGSGKFAVFAGVAVIDDGGFANVIRAQEKIGSTGVIQVEEGIVFIHAIDGEQVGSAGDSEGGAIAVSGLRIHSGAGSSLNVIGEIVAWVRHVGNDFGGDGGGNISVLRLNYAATGSDFNGSTGSRDVEFEIYGAALSDVHNDIVFHGLESGSGHRERVIPGI